MSSALILFMAFFAPAFSLVGFFLGLPIQNYILTCPFILSTKCTAQLLRPNLADYFLAIMISVLAIMGFVASLNLIYIGYLAFVISYLIYCMYGDILIKKIIPLLIYCNLAYAIFQIILLEVGFGEFAMLHSTDLAQKLYSYVPEKVGYGMYRVTGLFNESAPLAIFGLIGIVATKKSCNSLCQLSCALLILLSMSKAGMIGLVAILVIRSSAIWKFFTLIFSYIIYSLMVDLEMVHGGSIDKRIAEFNATKENVVYFGFNAYQSSALDSPYGLDLYSIYGSAFGIVPLLVFVVFIMYKVKLASNFELLVIFLILSLTAGSIITPNWMIFLILTSYLTKVNQNRHG